MAKRKRRRLTLVIVLAVIAGLAVWYFCPRTFLRGIEAADVQTIAVFDGNTGVRFEITNPEEIQAVVENIQSNPMRRGKCSVGYVGFTFRMQFRDETGAVLETFVLNSADTIRKDPFFYRCGGGLCYDYLNALEAQSAG